jgi:hypothetical protein
MNRASRDPMAIEMLGDLIGAAFGSGEDDRPCHLRVSKELDEKIALAARLDKQDLVVDTVGGFRRRGHGHLDRIGEKAARERGDFVRHRRREEKVLPALWQGAGDSPDGLEKTEVEHAIGLVEDKDFGLAKARRAAVEMILETAWGRDQNVEAARERLDLGTIRHAAEDHRDG